MVLYSVAFALAAKSALALIISHALCCGIIMHYDLSGKWASFQLHPKRSVSVQDYLDGAKSFAADMVLLFLPFMTLCYSYRADAILGKCCAPRDADASVVGILKVKSSNPEM